MLRYEPFPHRIRGQPPAAAVFMSTDDARKEFQKRRVFHRTDRIAYADIFQRVLSTGFQRVCRTRTLLRANINEHETCSPTTGLG